MSTSKTLSPSEQKFTFWCCFAALVATSFGFISRVLTAGQWGSELNLTQTQIGTILGVGLWPFAVSIVVISLIIDKIGYDKALWFAFICHVTSVILSLVASGFASLWIATFVLALAAGTVEAVINPAVATLFSKEKTKWLNILHAGWPGGLVGGGVIAMLMVNVSWKAKFALVLIPTALYGFMLLKAKFPVHERVAAGVSYMDMLKEFGWLGCGIVFTILWMEVGGNIIGLPTLVNWLIILAVVVGYGYYVKSAGHPFFIIMLLIMMPLATTELGVDSWVTELMTPEMGKFAGWLLVYTSLLMMILRFFAGPIVHKLSPVGLLAVCAAIAIVGLYTLSFAAGFAILVAATLYGIGKTFFWPTMLGVVAERLPKGGALTMNAIGGMGMLSVGVVGAVFMGNIQDRSVANEIAKYDKESNTQLISQYVVKEGNLFGMFKYKALDQEKVDKGTEDDKKIITSKVTDAKRSALRTVCIFPLIMLISYLLILLYFKSKGGYKPVELEEVKE